MELYDILACPVCKGALARQQDTLICQSCGRAYPVVGSVPVLLPDGSIPATQHQHDLQVRQDYGPWIPRLVMQSLPASALVLDVGAGNAVLDLPGVIRMDVTLTPYVDVVGDAHALPFRPGVFDFIFSHAVIEHLRQPFLAAQEMFDALRNGGYVYGECNFVFAYHSYPHHYFNASRQGIEQVFKRFAMLRSGVAPYEMPSFAILSLLQTYLQFTRPATNPDEQDWLDLLQEVLDQPLQKYDLLFGEDAAANVAAGVYYFGRKVDGEGSAVIPPVLQRLWEQELALRERFPNPFDLGRSPNILLWAKQEGRQQHPALADYFDTLVPFRKNATVTDEGQKVFDALPAIDTPFHTILDPRPGRRAQRDAQVVALERQVAALTATLEAKNQHIRRLESLLKRIERGRVMRLMRLVGRRR